MQKSVDISINMLYNIVVPKQTTNQKGEQTMKVLSSEQYRTVRRGFSESGPVTITGEQTVQLDDGRVIEQYIYNIDNYTPKNGKPFAAMKCNLLDVH